jgi:hypothetical protein
MLNEELDLQQVDWYLKEIKKTLYILKNTSYNGNIEFRFNIKYGGIVNMNEVTNKSLQMPK